MFRRESEGGGSELARGSNRVAEENEALFLAYFGSPTRKCTPVDSCPGWMGDGCAFGEEQGGRIRRPEDAPPKFIAECLGCGCHAWFDAGCSSQDFCWRW